MIDLAALAVLALAGYRATQLVVWDTILERLRERAHDWLAARPTAATRAAAITLITCTYCAGWWLSGAILATYLLASGQWHQAPLLVHGIEWLAVAGASRS
ncbi:DUF1360 domain-containing protein [Streptomyces sp. NPDC002476]|uniref:DUF1360 domain-containing protein n=1 Tax=Streptomyces sp. NPDC002476 TaxID=3364648 RepID=UPI0036832E82